MNKSDNATARAIMASLFNHPGAQFPIVRKVIEFICSQKGFPALTLPGTDLPAPHIGVAFSGGSDSVALALLLKTLGWSNIELLHCNFNLRGEESRRDMRFCEAFSIRHNLPIHIREFDREKDIESRMEEKGESVEMVCRDLRYRWFEQMAGELKLDFIALGHHQRDNVETFLLNTMRGCGINGAKGIPPVRGRYIRPMLTLTKDEILTFIACHNELYVTDSTNNENDYTRNRIRNLVLPMLEQASDGAENRIARSIGMLAADRALFNSLVKAKRLEYVAHDGSIAVGRILRENPEGLTLLYHILEGEIEMSRLKTLADNIDNSGKIFTTRSNTVYILDRGVLHPQKPGDTPQSKAKEKIYSLKIDPEQLSAHSLIYSIAGNVKLQVKRVPRWQFIPVRDPSYAWFDWSMITSGEKLYLRHPRVADRIAPFGMNGTTLLSDIFSDMKMPLWEKERQWVMTAGDRIIWVPGIRNSSHYPVTNTSEWVVELHIVTSHSLPDPENR